MGVASEETDLAETVALNAGARAEPPSGEDRETTKPDDPTVQVGAPGPAPTDPPEAGGAPPATGSGRARSVRPSRAAGPEPPIVAGYEVVRMIGQGGMGVVWEAVDHKLGRSVALKVHQGEEERAEALWIEARLAAKIAHPGIVPIHEVGLTASGSPYYTMDLVEGTSLRTSMREGPMAPRRALEIARAVAEAIGVAHARGIVHCDLKPGNIMVDADGRARVLDFGLAFAISGVAGVALGPVRGSPPYMSPEQIAGEPLTAATDVYSLGVVLYEMLAGELPFRGRDMADLLAAIACTSPEPPSARVPGIGAEIEQLCLGCLQKRAADRPADGRDLARRLRQILHGDTPAESEQAPAYVPRRPTMRPEALPESPSGTRSYRIELALASEPAQLWPYVSNTDRLNRAAGLPQVTFEDLDTPRGAARKSGRFCVLGMDVVWEENPYEWVLDREYAVFRNHVAGPLCWFKNRVTVAPREGGGTTLVHEMTVAPRGAIGVVSSFVEIQWKLARRLTSVYRRIDEAARRAGPEVDPFEPPHAPSSAQIARVTAGIARLAADGRFAEALLERLRDLLLRAPDKRLERIRPYAISDAWGERRPEMLDLLLFGANVGLVDIAWDLLCPACHVAHEVAPSLARVSQLGSCGACGEAYSRDLAGSVELIFRPHREVRDIATTVYCAGSPAMRSHVLAQQVLAPNERRVFTVTLPRADLLWRAERRPSSAELSSSPAGLSRECEVRLRADAVEVRPAIVRAGEVEVLLVNETAAHQVIRLERPPRKADSVTAAAAMIHPTFLGFFSDELLSEGQHLRVSHLAFVAVEVADRVRVLRELGDAAAFARFNTLVAHVAEVAEREQGSVCRSSFDGVVAAFPAASQAVRAALAIAGAARAQGPLALRVAVHAGRCIAVARGARVDYFGETIERTSALLGDGSAGTVAVSSAVDDDPAALFAMQVPGVERRVGTSRAGEFGGRRVTRLSFS